MSKKQKNRAAQRQESPSAISFGGSEKADLRLAALSLVLPALVWLLFLGWRFGDLLGAHDNMLAVLQMKLATEAGGWRGALYQWWGFGGSDSLPIMGFLPIESLLVALGFGPVAIVSGLNLFVHFGSAYLGARLAIELACWLSQDPARGRAVRRFSWLRESALVLLFAFLPVLAWRIPFGHQLIIVGFWALLGWMLVFVAGVQGASSYTLLAIVSALALNVFPGVAQQTLVYSAVFGLPLVVVLYLQGRRRDPAAVHRHLLLATIIPVLALLAAVPVLRLMIQFATGPEAMRGTSAGPVIYGYIVSQARDWWSSLPWGREVLSFGREFALHHEVNYAVGPLLLAFLFLSRSRGVLLAILGSALAIIGLASAWPGISDALLAAVPILKSFRVPARAFLLVTTLVSIVGVAMILRDLSSTQDHRWKAKDFIWPLGTLILLAIAGSAGGDETTLARELVLWGAVSFLIWDLWSRGRVDADVNLPAAAPVAGVLLFLAVGATLGFHERGKYTVSSADAWETPLAIRNEAWRQAPETRHPLNRVFLANETPLYQVNTGSVAGLGQVAGYFAGPKRFFYLSFGLRTGQAPDPQVSVSRLGPADADYRILMALYNVRHVLNVQEGRVVLTPMEGALDFEAAPAWVSSQARVIGGWPELWREFRSTYDAGAYSWKAALRRESWILAEDQARFGARAPLAQDCRFTQEKPKVELEGPEKLPHEASLRVSGFEGRCLLTVAMNFSTGLRVFAGEKELATFPSYGALLGVSVSAEEAKSPIRIVSRAEVPAWAWLAQIAGILGLIGVIVFHRSLNRAFSAAVAPAAG